MKLANDLAAFEAFCADQDGGAWMDILSPLDGAPTGLRVLVAGPDSPVQGRAALALVDELAAVADEQGRVTAAQRETARLNNLASCILGWNAQERGQPVPFNHANAVRLLRAGKWIQGQIDAFAADRRAIVAAREKGGSYATV